MKTVSKKLFCFRNSKNFKFIIKIHLQYHFSFQQLKKNSMEHKSDYKWGPIL